MSFDPIGYNETRQARADIAAIKPALPPMVLPSDIFYITTSQNWFAPADGLVRLCLLGGGGGGGGNYSASGVNMIQAQGGGAAATGFSGWQRVSKNDVIAITLGAGGKPGTSGVGASPGSDGGASKVVANFGEMVVAGGGGGVNSIASGSLSLRTNGGSTATGCAYFWAGKAGEWGNGGNCAPFGPNISPSAYTSDTQAGAFAQAAAAGVAWMSAFNAFSVARGVGIGGFSSGDGQDRIFHIIAGAGAGGFGGVFDYYANNKSSYSTEGGAGFAIIEFCQSIYQ